jgi:hypothetical protein
MDPAERVFTNKAVVAPPSEGSQLPQELNCCSGGGTEAQGLTEAGGGLAEPQAHEELKGKWPGNEP